MHRPYLGRLLLASGMLVVTACIPPALVFLVERVLDQVLLEQDHVALLLLPVAIVGLYLVNGTVGVARTLLTKSVSFRVVTQLRQALFEHLLRLEPGWHQRTALGKRLSWLTQDVGQVQYLVSAWCTLVEKPITLIGLLAAAFWMDAKLAALALLVLPAVAWPIHHFGRKLRSAARARLDALATLTASAQQSLSGLPEIQAFGAEALQARAFERDNEAQYRQTMRAVLAQRIPGPIVEILASVAVGGVLLLGGQRVFDGQLEPGQLIAFLVAMGLLNMPLKSLSEVVSLTHRALAGAETVFEVLDTPPRVETGATPIPPGPCVVQLQGVQVDYGDGPVLQGIDLTLRPGERVALVGASGAGKTTLLSLIPRFVLPSQGQVTVNGVPVQELELSGLRASVALVTQDPWLLHASVLDNLRLGCPDATLDHVHHACRQAMADDFIRALPQGYDTVVQEGGQRLSGGQRQRICIARALLMDAPILLLDEATSALDRDNEHAVQVALDRLMEGRTVLAVAHRASTVRAADRILVLAQGQLVEQGTHAQLLEQGGEYARLYG
jgi:subfamily B ATP-binding cassette protein MsbA